MLEVVPITLRAANDIITAHHRHHKKVQGAKFAIGLTDGSEIVGVATVGRPVARMLDNGRTAEVTRVCVLNGHQNACSMLYGACWRAARAMGYKRLITYILASETGTSLKASGYKELGVAGGGSWSRSSRPREDKHPTEQKKLFEVT